MCKWFKHDVLAHQDKKLRIVRAKHGHAGTGIYFHLLELMGLDDDGYLDYDMQLLSVSLGIQGRKEREALRFIVEESGLFEMSEDRQQFYSLRFSEQLKRIGESEIEQEFGTDESEMKPKRKYTISDKVRNQRRANSDAIRKRNRNQSENTTEIETEIEPKTGEYKGENKIENKTKDKDEGIGAKPQRRFVPPTLEEARAYFEEKGLCSDPERFHDYYTSNGWRVGKNPMKDWRATARNWEKNQFDHRPSMSSDSVRGERLIRGDDEMEKVRDSRW